MSNSLHLSQVGGASHELRMRIPVEGELTDISTCCLKAPFNPLLTPLGAYR
jgi:hypothetical protein